MVNKPKIIAIVGPTASGKTALGIALARKFCGAQREALLNKLSRAYQKPDFCISRDSVGAGRDNLLPLSLSWDKEWYYGHEEPKPRGPKPKPGGPKPKR